MKVRSILSSQFMAFMIVLSFSVTGAFAQKEQIKEARYFVLTDQPSKAIQVLKKAVSDFPDDASLLYHLGMAQAKSGLVKDAEVTFQKGLDKNPKEALNLVGKGYLRLSENQVAEGKQLIEQALTATKSKNADVLRAAAEAYLSQGNKFAKEALAAAEKARALNAKDADSFIVLGDAYLQQNNGGQAVSNYENVERVDPKDATGQYKVGLVYLRSKNIEAAEEAFTKAITIDPNYTLAYKELGEMYYLAKKPEQAVSAYEKYLAITEKPEDGQLRYAFFLFMAKNYTKANEIFKGLAEKPVANLVTLRFYAQSLLESGDIEKSRQVFENYLQKSGNNVEATDYVFYAKLLAKQNQDSLAILNYGKALALDTTIVDARQQQAELLFKYKRFGESAEAYKKLIALRTVTSPNDLFRLGQSYYYNQEFEKADEAFAKLIEVQPNITVGYLWQARAKSSLDPESEAGLAREAYEKLIEKALANPDKSKPELGESYSGRRY
jgi:tetratricopeptide (TPR) repeat protein